MQIQNQPTAANVFWSSLRQMQPQPAASAPAQTSEPVNAPVQTAQVQTTTPNLFMAPQPAGPLPQRGSTVNILV